MSFDRTLPTPLLAASTLSYRYADGKYLDYEPYPAFQPPEENTAWIKAWTGNKELDGSAFRFFAQDGTGGLVGFWLVRAGQPVEAQPVVFFGSEGARGVVARDLHDYLWLLAAGVGPMEAIEYGVDPVPVDPALVALATEHAPGAQKPASEVLRLAREEFPEFSKLVDSWCR